MEGGVFDYRHYTDVRRPLDQARHLPPWCYTTQAFFERERQEVFAKSWNLVGRADRIPAAGDYFTVEVAGADLIVVRAADGVIRAFANTCRHRGARLLEDAGNCRTISCPYHSWTYSLDGTLRGAPGMKGVRDFDPAEHALISVRLESWAGFLFVTLDPETEGLEDWLGDLRDVLSSYRFEDMVCTRRKAYEVGSNWKLISENSMEDYHTATVHRKSIGAQKLTIESGRGQWKAGHLESSSSVAVLPGESKAFPRIPTLTGKAATGTYFVLVYPSATFACSQDGVFWLELIPRTVDRTTVTVSHAFPRSTAERSDFEEVAARYYHRCDLSIPEDNRIAEVQQLGLNSPHASTGRVSPQEEIVHAMANWLLDRVLANAGAGL